ncbi:MAG: acyl-CoA/acyl-ACP dehydrogenase [Kofleriaceae bacterium]|nr:acyl-CoA/acyl-ACP dehydrogenase [Kofleriaceae bacterium]MCL4228130.1 acyl-CoA/acyl-ACP dehydrogenase [Myxococcales bacterium]
MSLAYEALVEPAAATAAAHAAATDRGAFPTAALAALRDAGLLGLVSSPEVGGLGAGLPAAAFVVERLARECGSTAMVVCMHYCATAVIEAHGPLAIRQAVARGEHLSTLAFSEVGSRSQFWAPVSTAVADGDRVRLTARKSWVTSARHADSYVWSSRPTAGAELSTLWLVPRTAAGLGVADAGFDGLGLRGNDSSPVTAEDVVVPASARLGDDGAGFGLMMGTVLPWFNVLSASVSCGLMEAAVTRTAAHAGATRFEHAGSTIADLPTIRAHVARMRVRADQSKALLADTVAAIGGGRADATLRVLESKAAAGDAATEVTDLAMRVCGGAAFRKEVAVERVFRDARAAAVMAPTSDVLHDFIGKAVCGLPLF